jgi:AraC-like DNA-binding protein
LGVDVLHAASSASGLRRHSHDAYLIVVIQHGTGSPLIGPESYRVGPGDVFVVDPEVSHAGGPDGDRWGYWAVAIGTDVVRQLSIPEDRDAAWPPEFLPGIIRDPVLTERIRRFHLTATRPYASTLRWESELVFMLLHLISQHRAPARPRQEQRAPLAAIMAAREFLDEHAAKNVSLADLAEVVGLSPFYLCRSFKRIVGLTPHTYQRQIRVRRARQLLDEGVPISEAAARTGFYDQAHLTRHFKDVIGVTPGRYVAASPLHAPSASSSSDGRPDVRATGDETVSLETRWGWSTFLPQEASLSGHAATS